MDSKNKTKKYIHSGFMFFLVAVLALSLHFTLSAHAESITVDITQDRGPVNRSVLGSALLTYPKSGYQKDGAGVWDPINRKPIDEMAGFARNIGMRYSRYATSMEVNWKDAIGPINERPSNYFYNSYVNLLFGLPEFLKVCHDIGSVPFILLSHDTTVLSPADAADLVEYLNAPSGTNPNGGTAWADIRDNDRIALGLAPGPWNVAWFEYGNETNWTQGYTSDQYVSNYLQYRSAMKAVDPNIKLGAVLENTRNIQEWSESVILGTGGVADFYITHSYVLWYTRNDGVPDANTLFYIGLAGVDAQLQGYYRRLNSLILELTGRIIPIAVTEHNGGFVQETPVPYRHALGNALINAEHIRQLMQAENIAIGSYWQYSNSYWGMIKSAGNSNTGYSAPYVFRPNYYPFDFYKNHFGDILIGAQVNVATYESSGGYGVDSAVGVHQDEVVDPVNLLDGQPWAIALVSGAVATESAGVLSVNFDGTADVDYQHASKTAPATGGDWYRLTGFIDTTGLADSKGVSLAIRGSEDKVANVNGGFENGFINWKTSYVPSQGATYAISDSDGTTYSLDSTTAYEGTTSVKVVFSGADTNFYHVYHDDIPVSPNTTYLLEGYIKTEGITVAGDGKGVEISVQDSERYDNGRFWATNNLKGTSINPPQFSQAPKVHCA